MDMFRQANVISQDGTSIGYQSIGQGSGVIALHGALRTSHDLEVFAQALAPAFTVHLIDRRGRGRSGPQGTAYSISKECEDVQAVQAATGAHYLFGHSYGGLAALEAARATPVFDKIALYEPGVSIRHSEPTGWEPAYEAALQKNDCLGAFVSFVRPYNEPLQRMPEWMVRLLFSLMMRGEQWEQMKRLLPENLNEHREVARLDSTYENYQQVNGDVFLLSGGKSSAATQDVIRTLVRIIPKAESAILPKLDHFGPENKSAPEQVAARVKEFFQRQAVEAT